MQISQYFINVFFQFDLFSIFLPTQKHQYLKKFLFFKWCNKLSQYKMKNYHKKSNYDQIYYYETSPSQLK